MTRRISDLAPETPVTEDQPERFQGEEARSEANDRESDDIDGDSDEDDAVEDEEDDAIGNV